MARVPTEYDVDQVQLQVTRGVVQIPENPQFEAVARQGDVVQQTMERIRDAQIEVELARADTETALELDALHREIDTDPDWETSPDRYRERASAIIAERGAGLRGESARRAWAARGAQLDQRWTIEARARARTRGVSLARADLMRLGEESERVAGDIEIDEGRRALATQNYAGALHRAVELGLIGDDDAAQAELQFAESVRRSRQEGLVGRAYATIEEEPEALLEALRAEDGPYRELDPDQRGQLIRQTQGEVRRVQGERAQQTLYDVLSETARTGRVVADTDERLAPVWEALGPDARLAYAGQAARFAQAHDYAAAVGSTAGRSLPEIAAAAEAADGAGAAGVGARTSLRLIRRDPAAYVTATQPVVERLRQQAYAAAQAASANPGDPEAQRSARDARRAYVRRMAAAQEALGLPPAQRRIHSQAQTADWAARVRAMPVDAQNAALDRLEPQLARMYGLNTEDAQDRAALRIMVDDHMSAFVGAARDNVQTSPGGVAGPTPERAVQGADYDTVRDQVANSLRAGNGPDARALILRLSPADQLRLTQDPAITSLLGAAPQ